MAPKARTPNKPQSLEAVFLQCDLTQETKRELVKWVSEERDYFDLIERTVDSGIKVSLSKDTYNDCFMCSLSRNLVIEGKAATYILVGRGGNLLQALQAVLYKHFIMLDCVWDDLGRKNARKETDWS